MEPKKIIIFGLIVIVVLFFSFYFRQSKTKTNFSVPKTEEEKEISEEEETSPYPIPTRIKSYTIEINDNFLSPAGISLEKEDKVEFQLKNQTKEKVIFKANQDLGIGEDIILNPEEEKSLNFTSPTESGEYKFYIKTSQGELEGILIVR